MGIETRDGFQFFIHPGGRAFLSVESDRLAEYVRHCREHDIEHLHLSPYHGYRAADVDFLEDCPHVTEVHLQEGMADLSGLHHLRDLARLSMVFEPPTPVDLTRFPKLTDLRADWHPKRLLGLEQCPRLQRLWLRKYKPPGRDLAGLGRLTSLVSLALIQRPVATLSGIEPLSRLREFEAHYCSRLTDVGALAALAGTLERLRLDRCRNVADREGVVMRLGHLTHLSLGGGAPLASLGFLRRMPGLRFFAFVGTDVLDGDLAPLLGLSYAGFDSKRHYSHTFEQVQAIQQRNGAPPVGTWAWGEA